MDLHQRHVVAVERQAVALERIATMLELLATPAPVVPTATPECEHPADKRIDFGVTNGLEDWQCGACGFRTVPPEG